MRRPCLALVAMLVGLATLAMPAAAHHDSGHTVRDRLWTGHWDKGEFEARLGRSVIGTNSFISHDTWSNMKSQLQDRVMGSTPQRLTLGLLPGGATLEAAARGDYNHHFTDMARSLAQATRPLVQLRVMWEANGNWYRWAYGAAGSTSLDSQRAAWFEHTWRVFRFISVANGVDFSRVKFELNYSLGRDFFTSSLDPNRDGYPGAGLVEILSGDIYCMWEHTDPSNVDADLRRLSNTVRLLGIPQTAVAEWSGYADKVTGGVQRGCVESTVNGVQRSVQFIDILWYWANANVDLIPEITPFERDPQPEGEFAMVTPEHIEGDEESFTWANGSRPVHDRETAAAFRRTFGVDDR